MAVPGSPLDPRAQGCNLLIREGATLVQNAADVLEQVRPIDPRAVRSPPGFYHAALAEDASERDRDAIVALLGPVAVPVDELVRQSGRAPAVLQTVLLELELGRQAGAACRWTGEPDLGAAPGLETNRPSDRHNLATIQRYLLRRTTV